MGCPALLMASRFERDALFWKAVLYLPGGAAPQGGNLIQRPQQQRPQDEAHQRLPQAHGDGVHGKGGEEGRAVQGGKIGDLRPHDQRVADHRRHRRQIPVVHSGCPQGRQQRRQRAENPVQHIG